MQKAEAQHSQAHNQPSAKQGGGVALESPQGGQIAQLEGMIEASPQVNKLAQLVAMANNSPQATAQRKVMALVHNSPPMVAQARAGDSIGNGPVQKIAQRMAMPNPPSMWGSQGVVMMKKDAALAELRQKETGWTATKVIKPKNGSKGIFRFPMNGNNIDTFIGTNSVPGGLTIPQEHQDAENPGQIYAKVPDHNLGKDYGEQKALDKDDILNGGRPLHFSHGDNSHGNPSRTDSLTWHHKQTFGHMELVDMNVHGAFWHYGGIAGWDASVHNVSDADDDGGTS
jgi:hypothetical protein